MTPAQRRALQRDCSAVAARARALLPDEFVVGSEITRGMNGPQATVAVRPPHGSIVSAGFTADEEADHAELAAELAAGAALEVKYAGDHGDDPVAR